MVMFQNHFLMFCKIILICISLLKCLILERFVGLSSLFEGIQTKFLARKKLLVNQTRFSKNYFFYRSLYNREGLLFLVFLH